MTSSNSGSAVLKIMQSRSELERLLVDEPNSAKRSANAFPRSKTVRLLTSNSGAALLTIAAGALLVIRPALAKRAMRIVPVGALLRTLALRFFRG